MKLISHRGNLTGPDLERENTEAFIQEAIDAGFDCEIDVWYINGELFLGHDGPAHKTSLNFLQKPELWCHAKNYQALEYMLNNNVHCFWHENDARTLTSKGYVWTYPDKELFQKSIIVVLKENLELSSVNIVGVCGDYVAIWKTKNSSML